MEDTQDLRLAELLASRLCHDLVGPVSAIGNGMELLSEGEEELDAEARQLVGDSAGQAATILQFYRLAYGAAGNEVMDFALLRRLSEELLALRGVRLDWPETLPPLLPRGLPKLLLNLVALALEGLPRGGEIAIALALDDPEARCRLSLLARGRDADLREEVWAQLAAPSAETLTPRSVHGFFTGRVAERLGGALTVRRSDPETLSLEAALPT